MVHYLDSYGKQFKVVDFSKHYTWDTIDELIPDVSACQPLFSLPFSVHAYSVEPMEVLNRARF